MSNCTPSSHLISINKYKCYLKGKISSVGLRVNVIQREVLSIPALELGLRVDRGNGMPARLSTWGINLCQSIITFVHRHVHLWNFGAIPPSWTHSLQEQC